MKPIWQHLVENFKLHFFIFINAFGVLSWVIFSFEAAGRIFWRSQFGLRSRANCNWNYHNWIALPTMSWRFNLFVHFKATCQHWHDFNLCLCSYIELICLQWCQPNAGQNIGIYSAFAHFYPNNVRISTTSFFRLPLPTYLLLSRHKPRVLGKALKAKSIKKRPERHLYLLVGRLWLLRSS